ncbi:MAG TPA: XrtA/PEP-CTERM system histidine kinase PrsK [Terriglobia bacterium]|nr:XrtA/PEP-CTERM system histidine kinase PrsK [Terriglobia bacterium]
MSLPAVLSFSAAYFSAILTAGVLLRDWRSFAHRAFAGGMLLFALEEMFRGFSYGAILPDDVVYWQRRIIAISALMPAVWLAFSLTYSRANAQNLLRRWRWGLVALAALPAIFIVILRKSLFLGSIYLEDVARWSIQLDWPGRVLEIFFLCVYILILFNLEQTIRSAAGRLRWQIKFLVLGVGGLFALRVYLGSQALLYSRIDTGLGIMGAIALIAANILFALSLARGSALNVDVYLSTTAIQNSLTVILCGLYLLAVGVLARLARSLLPEESLPIDAFLVFAALMALGLSLLSDRFRRRLRLFVTRHFQRPNYDYRKVWNELTRRTATLVDPNQLSAVFCTTVSESLEILSVSVWLADESQRRLTLAASTAIPAAEARNVEAAGKSAAAFIQVLQGLTVCVDLAERPPDRNADWPREIMEAAPTFFRESRIRYVAPLHAAGELVGVMTLNDDRVGKQDLNEEDLLLVETLGAQLAAGLLNLRLSARLRRTKELETFQAVSTFFVHDLKNLASRLSLTMRNLPQNFDNPEFRADALRVMASSLNKIDDMCARLAMLRQGVELHVRPCELQELISLTLDEFNGALKAELRRDLRPLPRAMVDSEQIHKVLTNLIINANEAVNGQGVIQVSTIEEGATVGFAVRDNGCGMSDEFIQKSLFRPFQTTKKRGLGIGLFHSKLIVEAHRGTLEVNSAVGTGTEFRVLLPTGVTPDRAVKNHG